MSPADHGGAKLILTRKTVSTMATPLSVLPHTLEAGSKSFWYSSSAYLSVIPAI